MIQKFEKWDLRIYDIIIRTITEEEIMNNKDELYSIFQDYNSKIVGMHQKEYVVLILFVKRQDEYHIVLEKRSSNIPQSGEISFPGGKIEYSDSSRLESALRETEEELGIDKKYISVLSDFVILTPPFGKVLYSFLATTESSEFQPNREEVERLIFLPVSFLTATEPKSYEGKITIQRPDNFPYDKIPNKQKYSFGTGTYTTYFYEYNGDIIWGLTAYLLKELADTIKNSIDTF